MKKIKLKIENNLGIEGDATGVVPKLFTAFVIAMIIDIIALALVKLNVMPYSIGYNMLNLSNGMLLVVFFYPIYLMIQKIRRSNKDD